MFILFLTTALVFILFLLRFYAQLVSFFTSDLVAFGGQTVFMGFWVEAQRRL